MKGALLALGPVGDEDDREAKLALMRKFIFAIDKRDEHAALMALEDLIDECGKPSEPEDDEDE